MSGRHRNQLPTNLPQLQNLIKRDPSSYKEEVEKHAARFCRNVINASITVHNLEVLFGTLPLPFSHTPILTLPS